MSISLIQAIVAGCAVFMVMGCTMGGADVESASFGEANRQTFAAQIIDPEPQYPTLVPTGSGDSAADAVERYRNDAVKRPERQATSAVKTTGGGN